MGWWQVPLLLALGVGFESLFVHHGINVLDEGWPLYAVSGLDAGRTLYRDVFFVFPPGHLLPAWIATVLAPPGVVGARILYAAFNVAASLGVYFLGRRLMPAGFAWLAAALVAVAAPDSHLWHNLFGYRYLVFSALALLCFERRLRTGDTRWLVAAGAMAAVGFCFRITPSVAVGVAIGVATLAASRQPRVWVRDGAWLTLGAGLVLAPVAVWLGGAGVVGFWREVVVRATVMTVEQALPMPPLALPAAWHRDSVTQLFLAFQFRLYAVLYLAYLGVLGARWIGAVRRGEPFDRVLLLAVVLWGGVYLLRAYGRSDSYHLDSALPPVCLLLAHTVWLGFASLMPREDVATWRRRLAAAAVCAGVLAGWTALLGSDRYLDVRLRGDAPLASLGGRVRVATPLTARTLDDPVRVLREATAPDDVILDAGSGPLFYVLAERLGPGPFDVVMPGTFLDAEEEARFVAQLEASPPAAVLVRRGPFQGGRPRSFESYAPRLAAWIEEHYAPRSRAEASRQYGVLLPR